MKEGDIAVVTGVGEAFGEIAHYFDIGGIVEILIDFKDCGYYRARGHDANKIVDQWVSSHHVEKLGEL